MKDFTLKDIKIIGFVVSLIVMVVLTVNTLNKKVRPVVIEYGKNRSEEMANLIINSSVLEIVDQINQPYIIVKEDEAGKIKSFSYNSSLLNRMNAKTNDLINKNIKLVQDGKIESLGIVNDLFDYKVKNNSIYYQVPLFVGSSNFLLTSLGPKIPIKFQLIGNASTDIVSSINSYGINNVIVEIIMKVTINLKILVPFNKDNHRIETNLVIASLAVQGEIPNYYIGSSSINGITGQIPVG